MTWVNGARVDTISLRDRALHYGDGVFETLAVTEGKVLCLERHLERLILSCERLAIPPPDRDRLRNELGEAAGIAGRGVLKLIVTRGAGGRGYGPPENPRPTRIMLNYPWPDYPSANSEHGVTVRVCSSRLGRNSLVAGIKHLNRLEQVLARSEWRDESIAEGLVLDTQGYVVEATMSNLFMVSAGTLMTPDLSHCGIAGVVRGVIIELAPSLGMRCETITGLELDRLYGADEIFLCNSVFGIWPVIQCAQNRFEVGPVTRRLRTELLDRGAIARA